MGVDLGWGGEVNGVKNDIYLWRGVLFLVCIGIGFGPQHFPFYFGGCMV